MSFCDCEEKFTRPNEETETFNNSDNSENSVELIRKCTQQERMNTSWDNYNGDFNEPKVSNTTPPFVSIMITDELSPCGGNLTSSSTQTEEFVTLPASCSIADVSLSSTNKDFQLQSSVFDQYLGYKRLRRESMQDNGDLRPWKKTKCTDSCTSSTSDLTESEKLPLGASMSLSLMASNSETSFKSVNSNSSFKIVKRRLKSDSNLFRDAVQRSRKRIKNRQHNNSDNSTSGECNTHICRPII